MNTSLVQPLVSIIIPVYNGSDYLAKAIDGALAQTYENTEILVINDGSCDDGATRAVALSYGDKIRYFEKENGGVSSALNMGIQHMQGEYFSWLSHDDQYDVDKIRIQVELLQNVGEQKCISLCGSRFIDKNSNFMAKKTKNDKFKDGEIISNQKALTQMLKKGCFNGCAFLIPNSGFETCGLFHEKLRFCQDQLMWTEFFLHGYSIVYSEYKGVFSRIHGAQQTQTKRYLYEAESLEMAKIVVPRMIAMKGKCLYYFIKEHAKYQNTLAVQFCMECDSKTPTITFAQKIKLKVVIAYSKIRPFIRRIYYKMFLKTKTQ